eukprot:scaffold6724_cov104-Isochrysis_galbana.AAC.4
MSSAITGGWGETFELGSRWLIRPRAAPRPLCFVGQLPFSTPKLCSRDDMTEPRFRPAVSAKPDPDVEARPAPPSAALRSPAARLSTQAAQCPLCAPSSTSPPATARPARQRRASRLGIAKERKRAPTSRPANCHRSTAASARFGSTPSIRRVRHTHSSQRARISRSSAHAPSRHGSPSPLASQSSRAPHARATSGTAASTRRAVAAPSAHAAR